jgi:hypothetical protein
MYRDGYVTVKVHKWTQAQKNAERGGYRVVGSEDRRGHGHDDLLLLAPVDGQPLPAYVGQAEPTLAGVERF